MTESSARRSPKRRIMTLLLFTLIVGLTGYTLVCWIAYGSITGYQRQTLTTQPDGDYETVQFASRGQTYTVEAFLQRGNPDGLALINVHGYRNSRFGDPPLSRGNAMYALGYTVLSPDLSDNGGTTVGNGQISFGYSERLDVLGAFDYLVAQGYAPERIGLMGDSMGAATSLLAAALESRIRAVWADSPYSRADQVLAEQAQASGIPPIIVPGSLLIGWLRTGDRIWEAAPIDAAAMLARQGQRVQLVHCAVDTMVPPHHSRDLFAAYQAAGVDVTIWDHPCQAHVSALSDDTDAYVSAMDVFFRAALSQ